MTVTVYDNYALAVVTRLWDFAEREFHDRASLFERFERSSTRPPVFVAEAAENNLLYPPGATPELREAIAASLPILERHRFFGSMRSSQALAQSVFGTLAALGKIGLLADLETEDGLPAFFSAVAHSAVELEFSVDHLGEPRPTSVDAWIDGEQRVAVECKFTESEFGRCSRPSLTPARDKNYERDHCDGTYTHQRDRQARCSLSEIGVRYWQYVPQLFDWPADHDLSPCPLRDGYQLARNILAACVRSDGTVDVDSGHALVIYDERNPSFQPGGDGALQWDRVTAALLHKQVLRRCSWQSVVSRIADDVDLAWLVRALSAKYGLEPLSA